MSGNPQPGHFGLLHFLPQFQVGAHPSANGYKIRRSARLGAYLGTAKGPAIEPVEGNLINHRLMCIHTPRPAALELLHNRGDMNPHRADLPAELRGVDPELLEV